MLYKNKRIAVDIDGTLTKDEKLIRFDWDYLINLESDKTMVEYINSLSKENIIYIHTARSYKFKIPTEIWLDNIGLKYDYLVMEKLCAEVYIDDRSIMPEVFKISYEINKLGDLFNLE